MTTETFTAQGVRIAVEGCGHGHLNAIYAAVKTSCEARGWDGVDLLIIGGDFQSTRNPDDLSVMSVPQKYRALGDFHEYYSGARKAPYLTIFIAGNHEASSYLWELYYGGWVAPNIYYMGAANVLRLGPVRIAGMSGIWKGFDYRKPHNERLPFSADDVKSFYHVREFDVRKLLQLRSQVDIGISHDWPRAIEKHGDSERLFRMKPAFKQESRDGTLGNVAAEYVMDRLRPPYWFSAHMHCQFPAIKNYEAPGGSAPEAKDEVPGEALIQKADGASAKAEEADGNPDEIDLDMDDDDDEPQPPAQNGKATAVSAHEDDTANTASDDLRAQLPASFAQPQQRERQPKTTPGQPVPATITNTTVRFLALDKCLPGRKFLQLCDVQPHNPDDLTAYPPSSSTSQPRYKLQYDPEWLAITRAFAPYLTIGDRSAQTPADLGEEAYRALIDGERAWVEDNIVSKGRLDVPDNFSITAPPLVTDSVPDLSKTQQPDEYTNPQTEAFCALVGVDNLWAASEEERRERKRQGPPRDGGFRGGGRGGGGRGGYRGGGRGRGVGGRGRGRGH